MSDPAAIYAALVASAGTVNVDGPWRLSRWPAGLFGREPQPELHRSYAVELVESMVSGTGQQQRAREGVVCTTPARVRWAYRLRGDNASTDYTDALTAEQQLVSALVGTRRDEFAAVLDRASRDTTQEGYLLGEVLLTIHHTYPLQ